MTPTAAVQADAPTLRVACLLAAFASALALRLAVGGPRAPQSPTAGLVFAGCLLAVTAAAGTRIPISRRAVRTGLAGGALVCAPVVLSHLLELRPPHNTPGFWSWALVVTVVATAEEVFLRGSLYDALVELAGSRWAIGVAAVAFALLHVPLYGWHVVPLDLAVGVVLGLLRSWSGTAAAPAVAHVVADLVGWFVR
jgi:membrane protease YdiL (CAAX protease family)